MPFQETAAIWRCFNGRACKLNNLAARALHDPAGMPDNENSANRPTEAEQGDVFQLLDGTPTGFDRLRLLTLMYAEATQRLHFIGEEITREMTRLGLQPPPGQP